MRQSTRARAAASFAPSVTTPRYNSEGTESTRAGAIDWSPIARGKSRVARAAVEETGSMQHFHAVLLLAEVVLKLHTVVAVSLLASFEQATARQLGFDLSRTGGAGLWANALRVASERLQQYLAAVHDEPATQWLRQVHLWLLRKRKRADADDLGPLLLDLRTFRAQLAGETATGTGATQGTALDLMELLVEVRNKTTAHAAYGADFYAAHLLAIDTPTSWLVAQSPLWQADLAVALTRRGDTMLRVLRGVDPGDVRSVAAPVDPGAAVCLLPGGELQELVALIQVDVADSQVYVANGSWRDSDSTAEFLCHSLEAQLPDQGKRRIELPDYAIRPSAAPASDTEELGALKHDPGVALNNLPLPTASYVRRPSLEARLKPLLEDPQRRHLITVRGHGGIGKTSLILAICRELAERGADCPYDAIIWLSARDIDLTLKGPKQVRRATGTLQDVWERIAQLFDAGALDQVGQKEFFEERLREDRLLLVLDNFETFDDQRTAYDYFDSVTYPPSKVVITSRHDFEGDTTVPVDQMSWTEASQLLIQTARQAGAEPLMTEKVQAAIYDRCRGHPYAMKLAAAHLRSSAGIAAELPRVLRNEQLLEALFRSSIDDLSGDDESVFVFLLAGQFPTGLSEPALRIVADERDVDLDSAVKALALRSLLEIRGEGGAWPIYDMPAMAREFARKLIIGHT
jgi:hypothetical protein